MTATPNPKTHLSYYFKETNNSPFADVNTKQRILENVYHPWRTGAAPPTAAALMDIVGGHFDSRSVGGLGIFVTGSDGVNHLNVLHGLRRYPGALGLTSPSRTSCSAS